MIRLTSLIITNLFAIILFGQIPYQAEKQRLDSLTVQVSDESNDLLWTNSYKKVYTYDNNEHLTRLTHYSWNTIYQEWHNSYKYDYIYDVGGNMTQKIYSEWNNTTQQWEYYSKDEYTYDANENIIQRNDSSWNTNNQKWSDGITYEYIYDEYQNLIEITSDITSPIFQSKIGFVYDTNGTLIRIDLYSLIVETSEWQVTSTQEFIYDTDSELTDILYCRVDMTGLCKMNARQQFIYDTYENRYQNIYYSYNTDEELVNKWKVEFNYDNSYTDENLILPIEQNKIFFSLLDINIENFRHKTVSHKNYEWNEQEWENKARGNYHYSSVLTSVETLKHEDVLIFPNPTNDLITFDLKNPQNTTVILHDAQGKHIGTQHLQNQQLSVGHLNSGVYFYQLLHNGEMYNGKFIVK